MPEHGGLPFLRELLLFLAVAGVLMPLLARLKISPVLGFLVVGVLLGPYGFGALTERIPWLGWFTFSRGEAVSALAELGVMFLLFRIGLELSTERLWALRREVFGLGLAQVVLSGIPVAWVLHRFGLDWDMAAVLGATLALSSTAIVLQLLSQRGALGTRVGQKTFAILLFQDLAVVPLLVLVGVLGRPGEVDLGLAVGLALLKAVAAVAIIYGAGRLLLRPLFVHLLKGAQSDVFMALTLLALLGISALTGAAGLSLALGAFLAGILFSGTEYRHQIEINIEPFKGLLLGLFFMTVGMGIDLGALLREPALVAGHVMALIVLKALIAALLLKAFGLRWGGAVEGGLMLAQGGEFAFIIVGAALALGLLPGDLGGFLLLVVGLSMLLTPMLARLGNVLGQRLGRAKRSDPADAIELLDLPLAPVVIAGFGRVGRLVAAVLAREEIPYVAVEADVGRVAAARAAGQPVYFGDASRADLLMHLHADRSPAIILTMDDSDAALNAVRGIRAQLPQVALYARARDEAHAAQLLEAGADQVIPDTLESSLSLAGFALEAAGYSDQTIGHILERERDTRSRSP